MSNFEVLEKSRIEGGIPLNSSLKPRYRAKISSVSPQKSRTTFERKDSCFLGVSLENKHFTRPKFESMLEWISRRFPRCTILIGDSIHRLTLQSNRGLDEETALSKGLALGKSFMRENCDLVAAYSDRTTFDFETCGALQRSGAYNRFHTHLKTYFATDSAFRESVEGFARHYYRRSWAQMDTETQQLCLENSSRYFLEEFAIFCCLQTRGLEVMVYPGAFSTLEEVANGAHPGVLEELRALTIVSLQIKRR